MKFAKSLVAASMLVLGASIAYATPVAPPSLTFTGTEASGTQGITATGASFVVSGNYYSNVTVSASTGFLSTYTATTTGEIVTDAHVANPSNPVSMKFSPSATPAGPSVGTPLEFFTITEGSNTLTLYLTGITASGTGANNTYGYFSGIGYITGTGITGDEPVLFSLVNNTTGTGPKAFTATISFTPEPTSAALLGTAMLGMAGLMRLRRRSNA